MSQVMEIKSAREESAPEMRDMCERERRASDMYTELYRLISFRYYVISLSLLVEINSLLVLVLTERLGALSRISGAC